MSYFGIPSLTRPTMAFMRYSGFSSLKLHIWNVINMPDSIAMIWKGQVFPPWDDTTFLYHKLCIVDYLERAQTLLAENDAVRAMIPAQFRTVLSTAVDRLDLAIRPGLITVRWTSLGVEDYFKNVNKALSSLRQLVKKVIHSHNPVPMVSKLVIIV